MTQQDDTSGQEIGSVQASKPVDSRGNPGYLEFGNGRRMYGGSFFNAPGSLDILTVDLMAERPLPCDIYLPIQDYSYPSNPFGMIQAFEEILASDKDVYVGCWGGIGRTGLFMSCFLKYLGDETPLETVRAKYNSHAVETEGQADFLARFPVAPAPRSPRPR